MVFRLRLTAIIALLIIFPGSLALAQVDAAAFEQDLAELTRYPSRSIGSSGYYAAADYLEKQVAGLPNVELKRHEYAVVVPVTQSATLDLGGGRIELVYPF